jgi:hypothetical protein
MRAVKDSLAAPLEGEVGDNEKIGMGSGQVPFLLVEQRRGWSLMIFYARATCGRGLPSPGYWHVSACQWVGG